MKKGEEKIRSRKNKNTGLEKSKKKSGRVYIFKEKQENIEINHITTYSKRNRTRGKNNNKKNEA